MKKHVDMYTDGSCLNNPGPGGYGIILKYGEHTKELSGGSLNTTNNRMELMAVIEGLSALKQPCYVSVYTDSQYVVNGIIKGWAKSWRSNGWRKSNGDKALNSDLWTVLLNLTDKHECKFIWLKGHSGHPENERCDTLARNYALSIK
jgi:ribonuclease HI